MNAVISEIGVEPVTIKAAGDDQDALLALLIRQSYADVARRFAITPQSAPAHPSACTADWIRSDRLEGVRYVVAACGDMLVGCAALKAATAETFYLMRLAVLPLFRRQGIGRRLAQHVCRQARRAGAAEMSVGLIAAQEELAAWYGRLGFEAVARRRFDHLPFEVLLMRRHLGSAKDRHQPLGSGKKSPCP
ncbi:MAG: GNAT family N-acetyltransferase [Desulfobacterales bacterium]|nr:GNAT family N-acetyltransferase [Desulfobacterales bacterium]MDJ0883945.1 GNAT family N-acetyltransferase [Desulfobacterales bacterium]